MRNKIIAGNWKMNLNLADAKTLVEGISQGLATRTIPENLKTIVAPSHPFLASVGSFMPSNLASFFHLSGQDCSMNESGAFTGDVSAQMLKNVGCEYTILGHSERRKYQAESDDVLVEKMKVAFKNDLKVIYCCGETLGERNAEKHFEVIENQLKSVFYDLDNDFDNFTIAYEPVWAIGTGVTASPEQAQDVHAFIRKLFGFQFGEEQAQKLTILYGGSCKPDNAADLFAQKDIDGGLIGGASLDAESFLGIIDAMVDSVNS